MTAPAVELFRPPGPVDYAAAARWQRARVQERKSARVPDALLLLEHAPVITLGRNADPGGILAAPAALERAGVRVERAERGGQATYHGPGQVVGYPILDLKQHGLGVRAYVTRLEEVMLRAAARFGVAAARWPGRPGVFTAAGKLGAVGVAVSAGVSYHGFALNVSTDLSHFRLIVPCGLHDVSVTSLARLTGTPPPMGEAFTAVARSFTEVFGCRLSPAAGPFP